ncbi:Odorant receptor 23 [Ephemera danica]|nr:Odorant receptor 23 [Ephemera danica]
MITNRLPVVSNFVFGHWFHVSPLQFKGAAYILAWFHTIFVNVISIMFCMGCVSNMISAYSFGFKVTVFIATGAFGMIHTLSRAIFVLTRKRKIEEILVRLLIIRQRSKIISNITRNISCLFIFYTVTYSFTIVLGFVAYEIEYKTRNVNDTNENIIFLQEAVSNVNAMVEGMPNYMADVLIFITMTITSVFGIGKIISTDILFYSWYMQIQDQYRQLTKSFAKVLINCDKGDMESATHWIQTHREINRLLARVNSITSPCITVSIVLSTIQICLVAYLIAKNTLITLHLAALLIFASLGLFQMFMYCNLGQKIRDQTAKLQEAVYSMPCLGSRRDTQYASLLICNAATERTIPLPGAPFFALSLEFFASILGAVFTYFIVLLQFN